MPPEAAGLVGLEAVHGGGVGRDVALGDARHAVHLLGAQLLHAVPVQTRGLDQLVGHGDFHLLAEGERDAVEGRRDVRHPEVVRDHGLVAGRGVGGDLGREDAEAQQKAGEEAKKPHGWIAGWYCRWSREEASWGMNESKQIALVLKRENFRGKQTASVIRNSLVEGLCVVDDDSKRSTATSTRITELRRQRQPASRIALFELGAFFDYPWARLSVGVTQAWSLDVATHRTGCAPVVSADAFLGLLAQTFGATRQKPCTSSLKWVVLTSPRCSLQASTKVAVARSPSPRTGLVLISEFASSRSSLASPRLAPPRHFVRSTNLQPPSTMRHLSGLGLLLLGATQASAAVVQYDWNITTLNTTIFDGVRGALGYGINNEPCDQHPISVTFGDEVEVHVTNKLTEQTCIHWHGLRQFGTQEMDGVSGITQCQIQPNVTAIYRFKPDKCGSFWYHGHEEVQYAFGLRGPLIVHCPANQQQSWEKDVYKEYTPSTASVPVRAGQEVPHQADQHVGHGCVQGVHRRALVPSGGERRRLPQAVHAGQHRDDQRGAAVRHPGAGQVLGLSKPEPSKPAEEVGGARLLLAARGLAVRSPVDSACRRPSAGWIQPQRARHHRLPERSHRRPDHVAVGDRGVDP
ncbi:hypothetical protein ON010_g9327 [Phytophthora cinnamomi]|nr:hypothetical protein ON010_g9327 [Phytophthora cinnamomi]